MNLLSTGPQIGPDIIFQHVQKQITNFLNINSYILFLRIMYLKKCLVQIHTFYIQITEASSPYLRITTRNSTQMGYGQVWYQNGQQTLLEYMVVK